MKSHTSFVKVRYGETDKMGVVYHGNYPQYLEIARIEWLESLGISYKMMEEQGVMLPVYNLNIRYKKSAQFDDVLTIVTTLRNIPTVRIVFDYKIYNQHQELITEASSELIFVNTKSNRPTRCPDYVLHKL